MDEENGSPAPEEQEESLEELRQKFADQQKRAEKAEAEAKELRGTLESVVNQVAPEEPEQLPTQEKGIGFDDLADNLAVLKPLEQDEVEELRSQAKELDVDPIKFAQSKAWKAHLETLRVNKKAEDDTPEPSNRTAIFDGKTFAEVVNSEETSQADRQAAFEAQRDTVLKSRANQNI
jgi:uncharacterized coiled-coil protein SlyX